MEKVKLCFVRVSESGKQKVLANAEKMPRPTNNHPVSFFASLDDILARLEWYENANKT